MKIIIYTITDCQFSKQEKEYLNTNKLQYEEKNLEVNKEFLTEMLAISNNFAGTPVTKIEKDDGQIVILKGFTKEEFDTNLGLTPPPVKAEKNLPAQVAPQPAPQSVVADVGTAAQANPTPTMPSPTSINPVVEPPVKTDELNAVLEDLQSKVNEVQTPESPPAPNQPPVPAADNTASLPKIPDFQNQT